jgi:hypothetical protein
MKILTPKKIYNNMKIASIVAVFLSACTLDGAALANNSNPIAARNQTVPKMQEVDASGSGETPQEAFKQAVTDAVRKVVGTLVSAETALQNGDIIKDQFLTLSNGFIEKVISKEETRQPNGTWVVKLKCVVRKGEIYGTLKEKNIPVSTKFDGVSLFADVVSQNEHKKSSVEMIQSAMAKYNEDLVTAKMLDEKPRVVETGERDTKIEITWMAAVDLDAFFNNIAPELDAAFSGAAKKISNQVIQLRKTPEYGFVWATPTWILYDEKGQEDSKMVYLPVNKNGFIWKMRKYDIDKEIRDNLPDAYKWLFVVAQFLDRNEQLINEECIGFLQLGDIRGRIRGYRLKEEKRNRRDGSNGIMRDLSGRDVSDVMHGFFLAPIIIPYMCLPHNTRSYPMALTNPVKKSGVHPDYEDERVDDSICEKFTLKNLHLMGIFKPSGSNSSSKDYEPFEGGTELKFKSKMTIPTELLQNIGKIRLKVECPVFKKNAFGFLYLTRSDETQ